MGHATARQAAVHAIPAVHALHLADVASRLGVTRAALFTGLVDEAHLADPDGQLPIPIVESLVARARALTKEPALGFHLGLQMRVSAHGYLGFAAMASSTVREALVLACQFAPTRTTAISLELVEPHAPAHAHAHAHAHADADADADADAHAHADAHADAHASLLVKEHADLGTARDFVLLTLMVGIWQIGNALTGRELGGTLDLAFPAPFYASRLAGVGRLRFGQPVNRLVFDARVLDLPLQMADPVALQLARAQCERELDALGSARVVARVRALVTKKDRGFRALPEVAAKLSMSPRTLKRRLAEHGIDFRTVLEEERHARALELLRSPDLSLEDVAERLGYSDVANFGRAFRRWTGTSPAARRKLL